MLACVDVHYTPRTAAAGCVLFHEWTDDAPARELVHIGSAPANYRPGEFYRRELPSVLAVLRKINVLPTLVIVDGYVWLGGGKKGLGAHLARELPGPAIVGVAKTEFRGAPAAPVLRGRSRRPLFVTTAGIDLHRAAAQLRAMHGPHRIPTLLKRVDRLCRSAATDS
ncbi:MAG: endonuclease V [Myxococcota bacterium]